MLLELKTLFAQQAKQELLQTTRDFHSCKQEEGQSVCSYVLKMKGYIDNLERLGHPVTLGLGRNFPRYLAELLKKKKNAASGAGDSGGEYMSQEFLDHLKDHGIISHRTPPYTPQHNGVSERRNRTLLDMVRSMMSQTTLQKSFWDYALETAARILNMVLTKKDTQRKRWDILSTTHPRTKSTRTRHAPYRMCLYIDDEEHELGDLGEPANCKAALLDPESEKWLNAMNVEMQSMKDNEVWVLVELPPNGKTVWIDYEETFSSVADIRAIRILIAIAAYYDYEIWQMGVKTAFLNGYLNEKVYMKQPEAILHGEFQAWKYPYARKLKLSKSQGASTPAELKSMQNVSYASAVGSIMYAVRCTRPDVAFAHNLTSLFQQNPVYGGDLKRELGVSCYTDVGYLTDADDLKFQTGYVFVLNGGVVDWKSAKQSIFASSSAKAEYIAAFDASKEAVWVRKFIYGLGVVHTIEEPISMYCDNTRAIAITNESGITKGARHSVPKFTTFVKLLNMVT
nr:retrotransposon protein, putative, Ty1-copia subclass [Tanacetum cinerariifolium]